MNVVLDCLKGDNGEGSLAQHVSRPDARRHRLGVVMSSKPESNGSSLLGSARSGP